MLGGFPFLLQEISPDPGSNLCAPRLILTIWATTCVSKANLYQKAQASDGEDKEGGFYLLFPVLRVDVTIQGSWKTGRVHVN